MSTTERLFCSKPFTWFEISRGMREGDVFLCCPSWLDTPVGNLDDASVHEIWNGPAAQRIRESVLDGSFRYCSRERCPSLQTVTGPVQLARNVTDPLMRAIIDGEVTVLPYGPRDINCSYDRSCNLSCPSCRTQIIVETARRDQIRRIQQKVNDEALADAELLYITGSGDPFGSPFFRKWLRTMRRESMPKLRRIQFHTNATLWTPEMWETIAPDVRALVTSAQISIDAATPRTYAVNRRGGEFATLLRNLEFIATLRANGPLEWLELSMVVQDNNLNEMKDFVALGERFGVDRVAFSQIVNWGTFSEVEFQSRAVHVRAHPRYPALVEMLNDPVFDDPRVFLGNLSELRGASAREVSAA